jgi:hypothetical protein
MGLTFIDASIANPARPRRTTRVEFFVDSDALYSVVSAAALGSLGMKPGKNKKLLLAGGTEIKRSIGQALLRTNGDEAAAPVIFGEAGDSVSQEALAEFFSTLLAPARCFYLFQPLDQKNCQLRLPLKHQ